jgi:hypothetical protein
MAEERLPLRRRGHPTKASDDRYWLSDDAAGRRVVGVPDTPGRYLTRWLAWVPGARVRGLGPAAAGAHAASANRFKRALCLLEGQFSVRFAGQRRADLPDVSIVADPPRAALSGHARERPRGRWFAPHGPALVPPTPGLHVACRSAGVPPYLRGRFTWVEIRVCNGRIPGLVSRSRPSSLLAGSVGGPGCPRTRPPRRSGATTAPPT